jgi:hypothetical protein
MDAKTLLAQLREERDALDVAISNLERSDTELHRGPGDTLIVDGHLAKSGSHLIDVRLVTLPDGRIVYGRSTGDAGPGDTGPN